MTLTFERATVYEGAQVGVESTPGTPVAANKRLLGLSVQLENMTDIKPYRPQGNKFDTTTQLGKEWTQGKLTGIACYNDLAYIASMWLTNTTNTAVLGNVFTTTAPPAGTWSVSYKGQITAATAWASAAALKTALEGLSTIGVGNVDVTFGSQWVITLKNLLSSDPAVVTSTTGATPPTFTRSTAAAIAKRWTFIMAPTGPDDVTTLTIEKGASGVANMAMQAAFSFIQGLSWKFNKNEASFNGDIAAQITADPFSMTPSPADIACIPVNFKDVSVYFSLTDPLAGAVRATRVLDFEFGITNRADGIITLNDQDTSFSNRIESEPALSAKWIMEHNAEGQAMLANMRANSTVYAVIEALGPTIEAGYKYRMRWTLAMRILKPNNSDTDGAYCKQYDADLLYSSTLGGAIRLDLDCILSSL